MKTLDFDSILTDSSRMLADILVAEIGNDSAKFKELYHYTMLQKKQFSMRSSRVFSLLAYKYPELITPYLQEMIMNLTSIKDYSVKRNFMQILLKYYWSENEECMGRLVDVCFKFMINETEPIAVRAYSMEILHRISKKIPEIKPELISTIEYIYPNLSGGLKSLSKKILRSIS
jgi:hypothetical protein